MFITILTSQDCLFNKISGLFVLKSRTQCPMQVEFLLRLHSQFPDLVFLPSLFVGIRFSFLQQGSLHLIDSHSWTIVSHRSYRCQIPP